MTKDKMPQGSGLSAKLRAKGEVFRVAASTDQVTQAQEPGTRLERIWPCLGYHQKHRGSSPNVISLQVLAHFLPTERFSCLVRGFLLALSAAILPFYSLGFSFLPSLFFSLDSRKPRSEKPYQSPNTIILARYFDGGMKACKR